MFFLVRLALDADHRARRLTDDSVGVSPEPAKHAGCRTATDDHQVGLEVPGGKRYRLGNVPHFQVHIGMSSDVSLKLFDVFFGPVGHNSSPLGSKVIVLGPRVK